MRSARDRQSHLATALGVAAVKTGKSVYRATLAELIEALVKAERNPCLHLSRRSLPEREPSRPMSHTQVPL